MDTIWKYINVILYIVNKILEEVHMINLTQHVATRAQMESGVKEPADKSKVQELLTFDSMVISDPNRIVDRAERLAMIAKEEGASSAMIGGAPYLMGSLEKSLLDRGIEPVYSFSDRVTTEEPQPDGTIKKVSSFQHMGFIHVKNKNYKPVVLENYYD